MKKVYEVISGSFKGKTGVLSGQPMPGCHLLKTGVNTKVLVTKSQLKEVSSFDEISALS